jgi:hypothetical protein
MDELRQLYGQDYLDTLPQALIDDSEFDRTHPVEDGMREDIDAKIAAFDIDDFHAFQYTPPANYKPRAGIIFIAALNATKIWQEDGSVFIPPLDSDKLSISDIGLVAKSDILQLYYTGLLPETQVEFLAFAERVWPNQHGREIQYLSIPKIRNIVVKMHKALIALYSPPARGGKKSKKNQKRKQRNKKRNKRSIKR